MSNIYYWEKPTFSKLAGKAISPKENLKKCISFEEQKGKGKGGWFQGHNERFSKYLG